MPEPVYALLFAIAFGNAELELMTTRHFMSKGACEMLLEVKITEAQKHARLASPDGVRFGGACVLMEK